MENAKPFTYGDSIFYLKDRNYTIQPNIARQGNYSAFPDHLDIDPNTGIITVALKDQNGKASQAGLRYEVYFQSTDHLIKDTTEIVIAGINYQDAIYNTNLDETFLHPIFYPASSTASSFKNYTASDDRLSVDPLTGIINLRKTIDNGFFNDIPQDNDWKPVTISYTDKENASVKYEIELIIYYYSSVDLVPSNVSTVMRSHQAFLLGIPPVDIPVTSAPVDESIKGIVSTARPRPPCIIIVGH